MIILAIGAHPDDLEISCAGTLAKLAKGGHQVVLCHASTGDKGHHSQLVWLKEHDGVDIVEFVRTLGKMRGIQAGVRYAEGFIQRQVWARNNTVRLPV